MLRDANIMSNIEERTKDSTKENVNSQEKNALRQNGEGGRVAAGVRKINYYQFFLIDTLGHTNKSVQTKHTTESPCPTHGLA